MVSIVGLAALSPSVWRLGDEQPAQPAVALLETVELAA
jgi:hypothetical protein